MTQRFDRAHYGPSWTEVILGALLSAVLGGVLAAVTVEGSTLRLTMP